MADEAITAMTAASTLGGTEVVAGVQTGTNVKITANQLKTWASNAPTLVTPALGVATATSISSSGAVTFTAASSGPILKQGANGRVGTFVANGLTPVTVSNTSVAITDAIIISLNAVGGTVGALPVLQTITASTGFTVAATTLDTSTYNYCILKNA